MPLVVLVLLAAVLLLAAPSLAPPVFSQTALDESCVVSALNRTTRVLPDGSWILPNVPSSFGQIRLRANCVADGVTRAGQSALVTLPADGVLRVGDISFEAPQPIPVRLSLLAPRQMLAAAGETLQLRAIATLPDGTSADLSGTAAGTNYRSSNPAVASVDAGGLVTAHASGAVLLSADNEGALGLLRVVVVASPDSDGDGLPDDFEIENGLDPLDGADAQLDPDLDDLSTADEHGRGLDPFDADSDDDRLADGREALLLGTDPLRFDTDGDGASDGLEIELGTDPLDPSSFDFGPALVGLEVRPAAFALVFDTVTGEKWVDLAVRGTLSDGSEVDLTATSRGTFYASSDPQVCTLGVEPGRVFAGGAGGCTVTVASWGRTVAVPGIVQTFAPRFVASVPIPGSANALAITEDHAFVAAGGAGLQVVELADRRAPRVAGSLALAGIAHDVAVRGSTAFVAAGGAGLVVADVGAPESPRILSTIAQAPAGSEARAVTTADGGLVLVASDPGRLAVIDASNPAVPVVLGETTLAGPARSIAAERAGSFAVVAEGPFGVELVDLSDAAAPAARGRVATADARGVALAGDGEHVLVADAFSSLVAIEVRDLDLPLFVSAVPRPLGGTPVDVARAGAFAFTADLGFFPEEAVAIFEVSDPAAPSARPRLPLPTPDPGRAVAADETHLYLLACAGCDGVDGESHLDVGQYRSLDDRAGQSPQVTITSPRDGETLAAGTTLQVLADAADDVGVLAVELLLDGEVVRRDEREPWVFSLAVPGDRGRFTLQARAFDFAAGVGLSAEVELTLTAAGVTTLTGLVLDPLGQPVDGAKVVVAGGDGAVSPPPSATTDTVGRFVIPGVVAGSYPVVVHASALVGGRKHRGSSAPALPVAGATTEIGELLLAPVEVLYPGPRLFTGATAIAMARADFDRDGTVDLAVLHTGPADGLAILRGRGDGRLELRQRLPVTGTSLAAGDLTLDGAPDLAVASASTGKVAVAVNRGDGTFALAGTGAAGATPWRVGIGDFDSDGVGDVVILNRAGGDLSLLRGNGDGTLLPQQRIPVGASPEDLAIHDFDLDGALDVAVTLAGGIGADAVTILRGDGGGGFMPAGGLSFSAAPLRLSANDFDSDGLPDLAVGVGRFNDNQRLFVGLGAGDGTLVLASSLGSSLIGSPLSMAAADLDRDGELDLAVVRDRSPCNDVRLLWATGGGIFDPNPAGFVDGCESWDLAISTRPTGASLGGGVKDLWVLDLAGGVTTYSISGGRQLESRIRLAAARPVAVLARHDLDRDGNLDLVYRIETSRGLGIHLGEGGGSFRATPGAEAGVFVQQVAAGDLNGDGVLDLVVSSLDDLAVLLGNGDATYAPSVLTPVARTQTSLHVADVTGDGLADVLATNGVRGEWLVFESLGGGLLGPPSPRAVGANPRASVVADFDRDGLSDVAVANFAGDDVSVLLGSGGGRYGPEARHAAGAGPSAVVTADLDLDGALDLTVVNATSQGPPGVSILLGDGEGSFGPARFVSTVHAVTGITAGDLDGDGLADLALAHSPTDDLSILLGLGDGTFAMPERTRAGRRPMGIDAADLDGDGLLDLVTADQGGGTAPGLSVILHR